MKPALALADPVKHSCTVELDQSRYSVLAVAMRRYALWGHWQKLDVPDFVSCQPLLFLHQRRHQQRLLLPQHLHLDHVSHSGSLAPSCQPVRMAHCVIRLSMREEGRRSRAFVGSPAPVLCALVSGQLEEGYTLAASAVELELREDSKLHLGPDTQ